jgi:hypothetical protein
MALAFAIAHFACTLLFPFDWLHGPLYFLQIPVRRFILQSQWPVAEIYSRFDWEIGYVWMIANSVLWSVSLILIGHAVHRHFRRQKTSADGEPAQGLNV